jgi:xanthine dehydrogenase accessory factor
MAVWQTLDAALGRYGRVAMVTVAATRGSTPREAGARLFVHPDGSFTGTIGGGTLEWRAIALAQAALASGDAAGARLHRFTLGPDLGQCCGGDVQLLVELMGAAQTAAVRDFARRERRGRFSTQARIREGGLEREVVAAGEPPGRARLDGEVLSEGFGDDRRALHLFGAGHVGRALVLALAPLPFAVTWIDPRRDAFPAHVPGNVTLLAAAGPATELARAPDGSFVLAMTHSHALDLAVVHTALADRRFAYVGVIGSATKRARFVRRLAEAGLGRDRIAALVCPIGVDGIASKAPAVIAAATAAELLLRDEALKTALLPVAAVAAQGRG